jgi:hypothetical protein
LGVPVFFGSNSRAKSTIQLKDKDQEMRKHKTNTAVERLDTMQLCVRYGISVKSFENWKNFTGFPKDAAIKEKGKAYWAVARIDNWLRNRPVSKVGRPAVWREVVGYPAGRRVA